MFLVRLFNVLMTIVAIRLLDRTGRRPLLLGGTTGTAVGMIVVALTFLIGGSDLHGSGAYIAIAGLLIYTGSFAIGLGPVFWLLISEIYPVKIRGQAMSVATMANWGANVVVIVSFLTLLSAIGNAGTFFLFAGLSIVALVHFQRQVPETKNRSCKISNATSTFLAARWPTPAMASGRSARKADNLRAAR
jgi:MFS family permease